LGRRKCKASGFWSPPFLGSNPKRPQVFFSQRLPPVSSRPLLVFDFDGVLVDGMAEYLVELPGRAALGLDPALVFAGGQARSFGFARLPPPEFTRAGRWVLVAAELARPALIRLRD